MPAIKLGPGVSATLNRVGIKGFDVGVEGGPGSAVKANEVTFDDVRQPWNMSDAGPSEIRNTRVKNDPKLLDSKHGSFSGWRKPRGAPLPVFCPKCKIIFPSKNYVFGGQYWQSWGNKEQCTGCGYSDAEVAEGIFDLTKSVAQIVSAPDFTHAMLMAVVKIAESAFQGNITLEDAVSRTELVSKPLSTIWSRALKWGRPALIALFATLPGWGSLYYDATSKTDDLLTNSIASENRQEKLLEGILQNLPRNSQHNLGSSQHKVEGDGGIDPKNPTANQTPAETGSVNLGPKRKPKAREIHRKAMQERRRVMGGKRHSEIQQKLKVPDARMRGNPLKHHPDG